MSHNISIESGTSVKLKTAGKYCDRDIVVTATGGGGGGDTGWVVCETLDTTGETGFQYLQGLRLNLRLPNNAVIHHSAFKNVENLRSLDAPIAYDVYDDAFFGCSNLKSVNLPNAKIIYNRAFSNCTSLTSVDLPVATSIGESAFGYCTSLISVDLPVATSIGGYAFFGCDSLTSVDLPVATEIGESAFGYCTSLISVDLPVATEIGESAFYRCTNLSTLILRNTDAVCQIIVTAVLGTKIVTAEGMPTGEGFVYVPAALYEGYVELIAYQAAQLVGDAATAEYIARAVLRKIEDYPEITGG